MIDWLIALLATSIGFLGIASEAYAAPRGAACESCADPFSFPIDKAYQAANAIFAGEVVGLRSFVLGNGKTLNEVTFAVYDRYSGPAQIDSIYTVPDCGYAFRIGDTYLVWAQMDRVFGAATEPVYAVVPCSTSSRTALLSSNQAQDDLEWLKINTERSPSFRSAA